MLHFYLMDDTPGCTKQACSLRDHNQAIQAKGAAILGVPPRTLPPISNLPGSHHPAHWWRILDGAVAHAYNAMGGGGPISSAICSLGVTTESPSHH